MVLLEKNQDSIKTLLFIQDITLENYFVKLIANSSPIGLFLYRDTYKFVNEEFCKISEYEKEELYQMSLWEIADDSIKEKIKEIATKRIAGEKIEKLYTVAPIKTKSGKKKWVQAYANSVIYKGQPHGLGVIIDVTQQIELQERVNKLNHFYKSIIEIQEILLKITNTEEIFSNIAKVFMNSSDITLIWIGKEHPDKEILPYIIYSKEEKFKDYLQDIKISSDIHSSYGQGPTGRAHRENQIIINNHSFENLSMTPWIERLKQYHFYSSASIPIKIMDHNYSINLYSNKPNFFDEKILLLFQQIKTNIEHSLYKIYQNQWLDTFHTILDTSPIFFFVTDALNRIIYSNTYTEELTGYSFEEMYNQDPKIFSSNLHTKEFYQNLWNTILNKRPFMDIFINRKKNGELFYVQQTIIPIVKNNTITNFACIGIDITDRLTKESTLEIQLLYDPITKLPNRKLFVEELNSLLEVSLPSPNSKLKFAIIQIDIFRFHYINENYGYFIGDEYLKKFSQILRNTLEQVEIKFLIFKSGNDEFSIVLYFENKNTNIENVICNFFEQLKEICKKNHYIGTYKNEPVELNFSYHAGIIIFPVDIFIDLHNYNSKEITNTLLGYVETAMYLAKKEVEYSYKFFQQSWEKQIQSFLFLKKNFYTAIENDEFQMFYQPYYNTKSKKLIGAEALVRWYKNNEIIPPNFFIPYLEETGQLIEIETIIFHKVLNFYKYLQNNNIPIYISINISPKTLHQKNFIEKIQNNIEKLKIQPQNLIFEITESSLIENLEKTKYIINNLNQIGIRFALDDFGTGYSSLAYLEKLPIYILKIDRQLIKECPHNPKKVIILETIIELSKKLNFITVAEGIENELELSIIEKLECDYV